jgi:tripartite-type tricarboxylate transporter receptor subunit TctC
MQIARPTLTILCVVSLGAPVLAQEQYPTRVVSIIVPFPPSGGTDTGARWIAQKLSERWGQSVVVENKPGAGGVIGADHVARAKPDGHTLLMGNLQTQAVNPSLHKTIPYNANTAFTAISLVAELPLVLLVHPTVEAKSPKELIALAKRKPGELTYSSSGSGGSTHLAASLFENAAGVKLLHVPYKGGGPAMQDLIAGHVNLTFLTVLESTPHIKSGKVRALAVTSNARSPALPELPTIAESAIPGYNSISWIGLVAPAGTPKNVIDKVAKDVGEVMATAEMKEKFIGQGAIPVGSAPAQFQSLIDADRQRYAKLIAEKGITAE